MKINVFNKIYQNPIGKVFIANLYHSINLNIIKDTSLEQFYAHLNESADKILASNDDDLINCIQEHIPKTDNSSETIVLTETTSLCSTRTVRNSSFSRIKNKLNLIGKKLHVGNIISSNSEAGKIILADIKSLRYWVTERAHLEEKTNDPDQVRDSLGLDYCQNEVHLFILCFKILPEPENFRRPTGLANGTPKFRARRDDEADHKVFNGWGMTLDLHKWRERNKSLHPMAGCPEGIILGPKNTANKNISHIIYLGETKNPSGCGTKEDHEDYANFLLQNITKQQLIATLVHDEK